MSNILKQRLQHRLPIVFKDFMGMTHQDRLEIDAIIAAMTGYATCDQATDHLSDAEFDQVVQDAIRKHKRKKQKLTGEATAAQVETSPIAGVE